MYREGESGREAYEWREAEKGHTSLISWQAFVVFHLGTLFFFIPPSWLRELCIQPRSLERTLHSSDSSRRQPAVALKSEYWTTCRKACWWKGMAWFFICFCSCWPPFFWQRTSAGMGRWRPKEGKIAKRQIDEHLKKTLYATSGSTFRWIQCSPEEDGEKNKLRSRL